MTKPDTKTFYSPILLIALVLVAAVAVFAVVTTFDGDSSNKANIPPPSTAGSGDNVPPR